MFNSAPKIMTEKNGWSLSVLIYGWIFTLPKNNEHFSMTYELNCKGRQQ